VLHIPQDLLSCRLIKDCNSDGWATSKQTCRPPHKYPLQGCFVTSAPSIPCIAYHPSQTYHIGLVPHYRISILVFPHAHSTRRLTATLTRSPYISDILPLISSGRKLSYKMSCAFPRSPTVNPLDKEIDLLGPHLTESHGFFDQYLSFDTFDNGDSIFPVLPELTVVEKPESESEPAGTSSALGEVRQLLDLRQGELDLWDHKAAKNAAASPIIGRKETIDPSENIGRAETLERDLSREGLQSPQGNLTISTNSPTPVPTITPTRRRNSFLEQISKSSRKAPRDLDVQQRSPITKFTCPPKVMGTPYNEQDLDDWGQQLLEETPKFDFGFQNPPDPLSPPPSARISDASSSNKMLTSAEQLASTFTWDHPLPQQYPARSEAYLDTPITTPTSDLHTFAISNAQPSSSDMIFTPPHQSQDPSSWRQSASFDYGSVASSFLSDAESAPIWWGSSANTSLVQPLQTAMYTRSASAHHHNATVSLTSSNNNMHLPTELSYSTATLGSSETSIPTGLMIQMPNSLAHLRHQQTLHSYAGQGSASARMQPLGPLQKAYFVTSGPEASRAQGQAHSHAQPHLTTTATPRHHQRHNTHNISTSAGRAQPSPSSRKNSSHPHPQTLSPRKSSSRATSSSSPSPKSGPSAHFHVSKRQSAPQRRRSSEHSSPAAAATAAAAAAASQGSSSTGPSASGSRSPRTPKTPKSGSADNGGGGGGGTGGGNGGAIVDFVNFTPSDSMKILTGVAPSGSSKTKARREKEALEKRRRLSQAAMRAVQAAGGNIDALVEEGFLV
jgi:hypothetical protein